MAHAVSAHIEFIETDDVFREIILHMLIHTELSLHRLFGGEKVCDLDVAFSPWRSQTKSISRSPTLPTVTL